MDPDPVCPESLDLDLVCPERLDPDLDPVNIRPDQTESIFRRPGPGEAWSSLSGFDIRMEFMIWCCYWH